MKSYFFKNKVLLISNILVITLNSIATIYMAFILRSITDISNGGDHTQLKRALFMMLCYSVTIAVIGFLRGILRRLYIKNIMLNIKKDMFDNIISKSIASFTSANTANYISAINNDTGLVEQDYFMSILDIFNDAVTFIVSTYAIFKLNVFIAIAILATGFIPVMVPVISKGVGKQKEGLFRRSGGIYHQDQGYVFGV